MNSKVKILSKYFYIQTYNEKFNTNTTYSSIHDYKFCEKVFTYKQKIVQEIEDIGKKKNRICHNLKL